MDSLLKKLKTLGVDLGKNKADLKSNTKHDLQQVFGAVWLDTPYGQTLHIHKTYPLSMKQGSIILEDIPSNATWMCVLDQEFEGLTELDLSEIVFFDTETSSLNLGSGAFVFLTGFTYFDRNGCLHLEQFFMNNLAGEKAFIHANQEFLTKFKVLASYNGKSFDVPMLRYRYGFHDMEDDSLDKPHLDLLFLARALWKRRLEGCRLADIEEHILGFKRSGEEVPGWLVPILYQDYLREGDPEPIKGVLYHNEQDVISLAALLAVTQKVFAKSFQQEWEHAEDCLSVAYFFARRGRNEEAMRWFEVYFDRFMDIVDLKAMYDYAWMNRRLERWEVAVQFWEKAAEKGHYPSMVELAKFYEHQVKDPQKALVWMDKVRDAIVKDPSLVRDDVHKRVNRLYGKMEKNDQDR